MCIYPKPLHRVETIDKSTGEVVVKTLFNKTGNDFVFENEFYIERHTQTTVPCGHCVECMIQHSNEWADRVMMELKLHKKSCLLTLTYKDNPVTLVKRDLQLFIKRLRKSVYPLKIRYFGCGEYGSQGLRPHYHLIVFGWSPDDLEYFFTRDKHNIYKSAFVSRLWSYGFISVGEVTRDTARYCSLYLQKLQNYPDGACRPFLVMSLKPSIGFGFLDKNKIDKSGKIYLDGRSVHVPRSFVQSWERKYIDTSVLRSFKSRLSEHLQSNISSRRSKFLRYSIFKCKVSKWKKIKKNS